MAGCIYLNKLGNKRVLKDVRIQRGGQGVRTPPPPLKNHKNIGFLSNIGPNALKNYKATKPACKVVPF